MLEQHRSDHDAVLTTDVPDTLDEVARQRIDALSTPAQQLVLAASVIGHDFDLELLAGLQRSTVDEVWPAVSELLDRFVLVSAGAPDRYGFRHALIRDAIYREVPVPEKARLHRRVAELLDERGDASDAFLSHHYEQAGMREEAFHAAIREPRLPPRSRHTGRPSRSTDGPSVSCRPICRRRNRPRSTHHFR